MNAGTTVSASGTTIPGLQLQVRERIKPVVTITSPSNGARITNNKQPVLFTATDETNGSGVDLSSLVVKLDDVPVPSEQISNSAITNGYSFTYTPAEALSDGSHTVTVDISDHDGNTADQKTTTFIVDTVAPTLNGNRSDGRIHYQYCGTYRCWYDQRCDLVSGNREDCTQ